MALIACRRRRIEDKSLREGGRERETGMHTSSTAVSMVNKFHKKVENSQSGLIEI
jgi:hypothetical protein